MSAEAVKIRLFERHGSALILGLVGVGVDACSISLPSIHCCSVFRADLECSLIHGSQRFVVHGRKDSHIIDQL